MLFLFEQHTQNSLCRRNYHIMSTLSLQPITSKISQKSDTYLNIVTIQNPIRKIAVSQWLLRHIN